MGHTYTRVCLVCPHCSSRQDASIDHLQDGQSFGPWFCDDCGGSYSGVARGADTELVKGTERFTRTLDLLVLEPPSAPIYFVMKGKRYEGGRVSRDASEFPESQAFFYEEHSCPTNWIGNTAMIVADRDYDPHGFLKFVRTIDRPALSEDCNEEDRQILEAFPEIPQP